MTFIDPAGWFQADSSTDEISGKKESSLVDSNQPRIAAWQPLGQQIDCMAEDLIQCKLHSTMKEASSVIGLLRTFCFSLYSEQPGVQGEKTAGWEELEKCYRMLLHTFKANTQIYLTVNLTVLWPWLVAAEHNGGQRHVFKQRISLWLMSGSNLTIPRNVRLRRPLFCSWL